MDDVVLIGGDTSRLLSIVEYFKIKIAFTFTSRIKDRAKGSFFFRNLHFKSQIRGTVDVRPMLFKLYYTIQHSNPSDTANTNY